MSILRKVLAALDRVLYLLAQGIVFLATAALVVAVALQVFFRYALSNSLHWTTEFSCFMLIYIVFFGAAVALRNGEHVQVDLAKFGFPAALRKVFQVIAAAAVLLFIGVIFYYGFQLTVNNVGSLSQAMKVSYAYMYAVLPITSVIMAVGYINRLLRGGEGETGA